MRILGWVTAIGTGVLSTTALATTFDFSADEFGLSGITASNPQISNRIFGATTGTVITLDGIQFRVTARETNGSGVSQGLERAALFIPDIDLPPNGSATDDDLDPLGIAFDVTINNALNGVLDPDPIGPFGSDPVNNSANSMVVQNPGTNSFINDFAPPGSNLGILEFELLTANPVILERLSFIDDVDARTFVSTNPGTNPFGAFSTEIGDIQINQAGSVPQGEPNCDIGGGNALGDNCVAGLQFNNIVVQQGQSFMVAFDGSGGTLGFEVTEIPLPPSAFMMLGAMGLLSFVGWRRRQAAA